MSGYRVIIEELQSASGAIGDAAGDAEAIKPGEANVSGSTAGHDGVVDAMRHFTMSWGLATQYMRAGTSRLGDRLGITAHQYQQRETHEAAAMAGRG